MTVCMLLNPSLRITKKKYTSAVRWYTFWVKYAMTPSGSSKNVRYGMPTRMTTSVPSNRNDVSRKIVRI